MRLVLGLTIGSVAMTGCTSAVPHAAYRKLEYRIPMRDGVKLYTAVYVPLAPGKHPMLMERTCYSAGPYAKDALPNFAGSRKFQDAGYIFVTQDVRGRFMSEGKWEEIRPFYSLKDPKRTDESTDAYDTVDYLVKNVPDNNGRVGVWGISYPGFYAAAAMVNAHPAIKAVSPQAPVSEWFFGDDVHHNGAFFYQDNFDFYFFFGYDHDQPGPEHPQLEPYGNRPDALDFFLKMGSPKAAEAKYYKGKFPFWNDIIAHPNYDQFWKDRSAPLNYGKVTVPTLVVGGWFDAEDLYGTFDTYRHLPGPNRSLVIGPWRHGGWGEGSGSSFSDWRFDQPTGEKFREEIEFPFFDHLLRGNGTSNPVTTVFMTGANEWKTYPVWPPATKVDTWYFSGGHSLVKQDERVAGAADEYISDPNKPVQYAAGTLHEDSELYMGADQSFAASRPDVLTYRSAPLAADLDVAGPIEADLFVSSSTKDADFIVKVTDESDGKMLMVRAEVMPARFRSSFSTPTFLVPGQVAEVKFKLPDVFHRFKKGHQITVQVASTWFPLVDRNPQSGANPYTANASDYVPATIKIYRDDAHASSIRFGRL